MTDYFFYTDAALLNNQTSRAFGPESPTTYRLSDHHTASSDANAYAVCPGMIFVQEQTGNPNLVNLILKPLSQGEANLPPIAFFIYRGILKSSLVAANGQDIAAAGSNDLTAFAWDSQQKRNESIDRAQENDPGTTTDKPSAALLGLNYSAAATGFYNLPDSAFVSQVFFNPDSNYQLAVVEGGWSIGKLASSGFSFEIVFDTIGQSMTAGLFRADEHLLQVPVLTGGADQAAVFTHWRKKEEVLQYLDPAAFYGSSYGSVLRLKAGSGFSKLSGSEICDQVLVKYRNKNRLYFDIRNEFNDSFNHFGNYGNTLHMAFDTSSALSNINYYRSDWPILLIDSDFAAGNTAPVYTVRLTLPRGDNDFPLLYARTAATSASFPENLKGRIQFIDLVHTGTSTFNLNECSFVIPNNNGAAVASYLRIDYLKMLLARSERVSEGTVVVSENPLDKVFFPVGMIPQWPVSSSENQVQVFAEEQFLDASSLTGHSFMARRGTFREATGNVLYFAYSVNTFEGIKASYEPIMICSQGKADYENATAFMNEEVEVFFDLVSTSVNGTPITVETVTPALGGDREDTRLKNAGEFIHAAFSADEMDDLMELIAAPASGFLPGHRVFLGAKLQESVIDDSGKYRILRFEYTLSGFVSGTSANTIELSTVDTGIETYRLINTISHMA